MTAPTRRRIGAGLVGFLAALALGSAAAACEAPVSVCPKAAAGSFPLIRGGAPAAVLTDANADRAVRHVANSFAADLQRVGGRPTSQINDPDQARGPLVIIGVRGQSPVIDGLIARGKIEASDLAGQWEAFRQVVVDRPFPNVPRALVIVGSDRRGAVFGAYDLSEKMGVSPWHWFADAPIQRKANLFVTAGARRDQPKVKYRGFFINDEAPALTTWAEKRFGGANSKMYAHVFELLLRMKGNYLWPAMWQPRAFNDDDPRNMVLADEMGVVMGTSHHEPMTRAHDEWHRNKEGGVTGGRWDYATNGENLRRFWRGGIERMMSKGDGRGYEAVVTVGMRGDGDEAMSDATATQLLEKIVADQRKIIAEVTGRPPEQTPQVWALYKEVQDYYDNGMKVPDDVTLLFADDNWGQIRRLPTGDLNRKGGYGVYYHFDYVGAPRNYKWLNNTQIEKTWQQMDLAWERGARTLWIVNVGDIKPMEFPLSFFMDQAWDPEAMTPEALARYPQGWAGRTFGAAHGAEIGELITRYAKYAARRKPELIDSGSFRIGEATAEALDGGEFGEMVAEWDALERDMLRTKAKLPAQARDAYLQIVEHPIAAMANLYRLYYAVAWNRRLAFFNDPRANVFADQAEAAFARDQALTDAYHRANDGKWDGMMSQTHIGYTYWQQPPTQVMPRVTRVDGKGAPKPIVFAKPHRASENVIAVEAPRFSRVVNGAGLAWRAIPHLGRTEGAVVALPQGRAPTSEKDAVRVEYDVKVAKAGDLTVQLYLAPTLDTTGRGSQRIGVSVDDRPMQVVVDKLLPAPTSTTLEEQAAWNKAVEDNARVVSATFTDVPAGPHTIKVWRLDDNVVLTKVVASTGPIPIAYLGAPTR
ncbi:glycosyl hydrolase 115 family protein [Phenylobacterium sp.]|uniref:glycosyl hydrolase 115 family protein n=1 Tax=Phenylobacterium sp. TaxID=1871053 RepID=UPI002810ED6D|nr:glycosyl hydrolase 115 family protein [Phenylobacterium sp.]